MEDDFLQSKQFYKVKFSRICVLNSVNKFKSFTTWKGRYVRWVFEIELNHEFKLFDWEHFLTNISILSACSWTIFYWIRYTNESTFLLVYFKDEKMFYFGYLLTIHFHLTLTKIFNQIIISSTNSSIIFHSILIRITQCLVLSIKHTIQLYRRLSVLLSFVNYNCHVK